MAGTFVKLVLLAAAASVSAGYAVCFLLRKLGPQAARVEERWFWVVLLGVGALGASLFTEHVLKISSATGNRLAARAVLAAAAAWLPYALPVSVCTLQASEDPEVTFLLAPLAALGGTGLIVYQATNEVFPEHPKQPLSQLPPEERLKKILWIVVTADVYWLLSRVLFLLLLAAAFFLAAVVVSLAEALWPGILSDDDALLVITFSAGLLLGGGVLGYSVRRLRKRVATRCSRSHSAGTGRSSGASTTK